MAKTAALEKPVIKAKAIALVIDGLSDSEVAAALSDKRMTVTRQAITKFRHRHQDEIGQQVKAVEKQITDFVIAEKVNRIAEADLRRRLLHLVREARARGETGIETGIVARTLKVIGSGKNQEVVEEFKVDTAFMAEWRANERQVAEELAQLPRPSINIDNRSLTVFTIKVDDGGDGTGS